MQKKIPMRQCMGCNEHRPKKELLRVVRTADGKVVLDFTGKLSGRGAYICPDVSCLKKARKSRRLDHTLEIQIPEEIYEAMELELERRHEIHD